MPVWLITLLGVLNAMPALGQLIAALAKLIEDTLNGLFQTPLTPTGVEVHVRQATDYVGVMDTYTTEAGTWLRNEANDLDGLMAMFPGIDKELFARWLTMEHLSKAAGVTPQEAQTPAANLVRAAHAQLRIG